MIIPKIFRLHNPFNHQPTQAFGTAQRAYSRLFFARQRLICQAACSRLKAWFVMLGAWAPGFSLGININKESRHISTLEHQSSCISAVYQLYISRISAVYQLYMLFVARASRATSSKLISRCLELFQTSVRDYPSAPDPLFGAHTPGSTSLARLMLEAK